ncbi:MAG: cobalamin biosynthesis protein [Nitrososphaerales archaeon]
MVAETLLILGAAVALDFIVSDPPNRLHPTAWVGRLIGAITPKLKGSSANVEKVKGTIFAVIVVSFITLSTFYFLQLIEFFLGMAALVIASIIMLKSTIAIRGMEVHARSVMDALANNDLATARAKLANIVGRETSNLDEQHILSATIESIGESTVDGITSPIFYYALFGIPGAFAYRTINTLDSMIGYRDVYHRDIGWFSAHLDTIANYIPARVTALLMIPASKMVGADWKNSLYIMSRDKHNTPSLNGGWAMAAIAGALRVRLEKIGYYSLGEAHEQLTLLHCIKAISIMKMTTILFCIAVALPAIILISLVW